MAAPVIDLTAASASSFEPGDYVAYRNPEKFLLGDPDHTAPARVIFVPRYTYGRVPIVDLASGVESLVDPRFLRLIPAGVIMRDLDAVEPAGTVRLELIEGGAS